MVAALCITSLVIPSKQAKADEATIKITTSALKKASPTLSISVNGMTIPFINAMRVKGKYLGEKTYFGYIPIEPICKYLGASLVQKKKTIKITTADGITLKFKVGKDGYTLTVPGLPATEPLKFGKAVDKDGVVYVPADLFVNIGSYIGYDISYDVSKKELKLYVNANTPVIEEPITGGWENAESPVISKKLNKLINKAAKKQVGVDIDPVALLATQVVAGTNYMILSRVKYVVPDAVANYVIVVLYEDLEGNAEFTDFVETGVASQINDLPGGWSQPSSVALDKTYENYFLQATTDNDGVTYTPIAVVETQIVNGVNVCVFCSCKAVVPDAPTGYAFVYINVDFSTGKTSITGIEACK